MTIDKQTQKGFTLIELMIVVAIIGILASIAIPQFSAFRVKAFNSAAIADLHGINLAQEGLFTDFQEYGSTQAVATAKGAAAGIVISTTVPGQLLRATATAATQSMPLTMSTNVTAISNTTATGAAATSIAKHLNGDKGYGGETDQAGVYWIKSKEALKVAVGAIAGSSSTSTADLKGVKATAAKLDLASPWVVM